MKNSLNLLWIPITTSIFAILIGWVVPSFKEKIVNMSNKERIELGIIIFLIALVIIIFAASWLGGFD